MGVGAVIHGFLIVIVVPTPGRQLLEEGQHVLLQTGLLLVEGDPGRGVGGGKGQESLPDPRGPHPGKHLPGDIDELHALGADHPHAVPYDDHPFLPGLVARSDPTIP